MGQNILVAVMAVIALSVGVGAWLSEIRGSRDDTESNRSQKKDGSDK